MKGRFEEQRAVLQTAILSASQKKWASATKLSTINITTINSPDMLRNITIIFHRCEEIDQSIGHYRDLRTHLFQYRRPSDKGKWLIALHAGFENEWISGAALVFQSKRNSGDYHG